MANEISHYAVNGMAHWSEVEEATLFGEPLLDFDRDELARAVVWYSKRYKELLERREVGNE